MVFATAKAKSIRQNTCSQIFVSDKGFLPVYPMKSQSEFTDALHWFCKQVGVPTELVVDVYNAQISSKLNVFALK